MTRWFRLYDDMLDDPKVQLLSPELFKTWINLLAVASKHHGRLPPLQQLAFSLRVSPQDMQGRIDDLVLAGLIDITNDNALEPHNWSKRQWKSDDSAERVRRFRQKKQQDIQSNSAVTVADNDRNSDVTVTGTTPESDSESNVVAEARTQPGDHLDTLQTKLEAAAAPALAPIASHPGLMNLSIPLMWIEQGCDLERDVLPAVAEVARRRAGKGLIVTWNYFTQAVANAKTTRLSGMPAGIAQARTNRKKPAKQTVSEILALRRAESSSGAPHV